VSLPQGELSCAHIRVRGRVQGVGFRAFIQQIGTQLELKGWVRNVGYDGVEIMVEGERLKVDNFIELAKNGPRASRVDNFNVEWEPYSGNMKSFGVKYNI
jgi:acylphosphatase